MQEGKALEAVAAVGQQRTAARELHEPNRAAGAGLDPEGHHARHAVVAGVKARVGTERLARLEQPIQAAQATGFQGLGIQRMGLGGFPERQQLIPEPHHMGVGDVLQTQVKGICSKPPGLLGAKDTPVEEFVRLLFGVKAFRAYKAIAQLGFAALKRQGRDHPVPIEGVMYPLPTTLEPARAVAIERALELSGDRTAGGRDRNPIELHTNVAEGAGPIRAVVAEGRGDGHGRRR